jgi:hypothetical protein
MKITIPDQLKADVPQTIWGKVLMATPENMNLPEIKRLLVPDLSILGR